MSKVGDCSKQRWSKCDYIHNTLRCCCWRSFPTHNTSNNNIYKLELCAFALKGEHNVYIFPRSQHTCLYIYIDQSEFISSCIRLAVGSNIVQITRSIVFLFFFYLKWMSNNHFLPFQINTIFLIFVIFFTKWLPAAILDVQNSPSMAFLAVSDQYETFF